MKRCYARERVPRFLNVVKEGASEFILMLNLDKKNKQTIQNQEGLLLLLLLLLAVVKNLPRPCLWYHFTLSSQQHYNVGICFHLMAEETETQS